MSNNPTPTTPSLLRTLLKYRKVMRAAIFLVAAAFAGLLIVEMARAGGFGAGLRIRWFYYAAVSLITIFVGTLDLAADPAEEDAEAGRLRLEIMLLGGLLGLATAVFGFVLPLTTYREQLAAGLDSWRANPTALIYPGLAVLGGLALMFASVQLVRGLERQNQAYRRVIYGYNVALTTLLLVAVLALPNILAYAEPFTNFFGRPFDWTASDVNTISPLMRNYLADLKEPVKVYLMIPSYNPISQDTQTLLSNCKSLNSRFSWELVDSRYSQRELIGLMEKYNISDPQGMLVVVGEESDKTKPDFTFVKFRDMFQEEGGAGRRSGLTYSYSGENALYNALATLTEGKMVIYFTTGHGELTTEGGMPPGMPPGMPRTKAGGLGKLRDRLTERKSVEVKSLALDRSVKKVPDDASVVVVVRPTQPFSAEEVKILREYAHRDAKTEKAKDANGREREEEKVTAGKLIFLVEPIFQKEAGNTTLMPTGLDSLMAEFGVRLGSDRIVSVSPRVQSPLQVYAVPDPDSPNSVAKAFTRDSGTVTLFTFQNVRSLEPLEAKGAPRSVDNILVGLPQLDIVVDKQFNVDPTDLVRGLRADIDRLDKVRATKPVPVALAVSEGGTPPGMPRDPAHSGELKNTPRMVVFGSAMWVNDEGLEGSRGTARMDLFNSCVSWLREKSSIGAKIESKKRKDYELNIAPQDTGKVTYLPLGLLLLGVVGLGTGVWVVRRR